MSPPMKKPITATSDVRRSAERPEMAWPEVQPQEPAPPDRLESDGVLLQLRLDVDALLVEGRVAEAAVISAIFLVTCSVTFLAAVAAVAEAGRSVVLTFAILWIFRCKTR